jgi:hypothetical protein
MQYILQKTELIDFKNNLLKSVGEFFTSMIKIGSRKNFNNLYSSPDEIEIRLSKREFDEIVGKLHDDLNKVIQEL